MVLHKSNKYSISKVLRAREKANENSTVSDDNNMSPICPDFNKEDDITYGFGVRHVQVFLFFITITFGFIARAHLGVTIVGMTNDSIRNVSTTNEAERVLNETMLESGDYTEIFVDDFTLLIDNDTLNDETKNNNQNNLYKHRTYNWRKSVQEIALGSFFLGYLIMMIPFGLICQRWGGKISLQIAMFVNSIVSFITPWVITWGGWKGLCFLRVLQGISQSGFYPGVHTLLANWVPLRERGRLSSYVFIGSGFGTAIAFQLSGVLAFSRFGWPSMFWVSGFACSIGFILITFFGTASPSNHKFISESEKKYITGRIENAVKMKRKVPWKSILLSVPVWATIATHVGNVVCFMFLFMQVPTYLYAILKVNIKNSGILSSLPYVGSILSSLLFGTLSDFLTNKKILSVKNARRLSNSIGCVIPSVCMAFISYTTNILLAVTCLIIALSAHSAVHSGWMINYIDLSPNYSGALMAFGSTLSSSMVLMLPVVISHLVTDVTNQCQWRIAMFSMASLTFGANIVFVLLMSADVQTWNDDEHIEKECTTHEIQRDDKSQH